MIEEIIKLREAINALARIESALEELSIKLEERLTRMESSNKVRGCLLEASVADLSDSLPMYRPQAPLQPLPLSSIVNSGID